MKKVVLFLMMCLSGFFASATTYNVVINDYDFNIQEQYENIDITSQIGELLLSGDKVVVTVEGFFNYNVTIDLKCIADNSEAAGWYKMLTAWVEAKLGKTTIGERFSKSYEFTITEDAVTNQKYIVQIGIGCSVLEEHQILENGGIVTLRPNTNFIKKLDLSYNYFGADDDGDGISDGWHGRYPNEFLNAVIEATGNTAWEPSVGEKFTITMEGVADFSGYLSFAMVDIRGTVDYWAPFADYLENFRVKKGSTFSVQHVFEITQLTDQKYGQQLEDPFFVISCAPSVTSTNNTYFDAEQIMHLFLTKYSVEYTEAEKAIGNDMELTIRALDTIALYLPSSTFVASTYGESGTMKYAVSCDDANFPILFSGDTLYIMPSVDYVGQSVNIFVTGTIANDDFAKGTLTAVVKKDSIVPNPQIALVTVSETSSKNLVVWQKFDTDKIDHYNIYRESDETDVFTKIAEVPYSETSVYEDLEADPTIHSWRYKISATPVDTRYSETDLSEAHQTLHLQKNLAMGGTGVNLIWNKYEGISFSTYYIIRKVVDQKNIKIDTLATLASNYNTYTDVLPASGTNAYYVAIKLPQTIDPNELLKSESGPFILAISNIAEVENEQTSISEIQNSNVEVHVEDRVIAIMNAECGAKVYDVSGRFVAASDAAPVQQIEMSKAGVYIVKVGKKPFKVVLN